MKMSATVNHVSSISSLNGQAGSFFSSVSFDKQCRDREEFNFCLSTAQISERF